MRKPKRVKFCIPNILYEAPGVCPGCGGKVYLMIRQGGILAFCENRISHELCSRGDLLPLARGWTTITLERAT